MAKARFLNTIKNNISLNKCSTQFIFICLLLIFSIILFFILTKHNNYTIENYTTANNTSGIIVEIILWSTDEEPNSPQKQQFISFDWDRIVREHYKIYPNVHFHNQDYSGFDTYMDKNRNTQYRDIDFTNKAYYPLISIFVVNTNNNTRDFAGIVTGEKLTYENTMLMLNTTIRNNYSSLFTNTEL